MPQFINMSAKARLTAFLLLILLCGLKAISARAFELAYDDGTYGYAWSDFYPHGAAVKFSPPVLPWRITAVSFYGFATIRGPSTNFVLEVRDSDFELIYRSQHPISKYFENNTPGWARVPLPNVTLGEEFYICIYPMFTIDGNQLWIGADDRAPISGRSFLVDGERAAIVKAWDEGSDRPKDFMLRVEGEQAPSIVSIDLSSVRVDEDGIEFSFRVVSVKPVLKVEAFLKSGLTWEKCAPYLEYGTLRVKVSKPGNLTVNVVTHEATVGTTIEVKGRIWEAYSQLKERMEELKFSFESLSSQVEDLEDEMEELSLGLVQLNDSARILEGRWLDAVAKVKELNKKLEEERSSYEASIKRLGEESDMFKATTAFLALALIVAAVFILKLNERLKSPSDKKVV